MNIQEFVETTLVEIFEGVKGAQNKLGPVVGDNINPWIRTTSNRAVAQSAIYIAQNKQLIHMVDFDVAVTADSSSNAGGKAGLRIAGIGGIEGGGSSVNRDVIVSRVKFQVPITLPEPGVPAKQLTDLQEEAPEANY